MKTYGLCKSAAKRTDKEINNIRHYKSNFKENIPDERAIENITTFIDAYIEIMMADKPKVEELGDLEIYNERFRQIVLKKGE